MSANNAASGNSNCLAPSEGVGVGVGVVGAAAAAAASAVQSGHWQR